jgi:hypothetical protein
MEVVMDSQVYLKGGDGGCAICRGEGVIRAFISFVTYSRERQGMDRLFRKEVIGNSTISRRILRLE